MRYHQLIVSHLKVQHVGSASFGEIGNLQSKLDYGRRGTPVFDVEKGSPLSESVGSVLGFDADALPEMCLANAPNEIFV
jgi:hypothetical protein